MKTLKNKVALVTGAGSGIGEATAKALASAGAAVVVTDVSLGKVGRVVDAIRAQAGTATELEIDVSNPEAWRRAVKEIEDTYGALHILVNNAGIGTLPDVEHETLEGWERLIAINQTGVFLGMQIAGGLIKDSGGGSVINISSIFGTVGGFGGSFAYHASKGAVRIMSKNAALHWAKQGIRVNSIHPGFIKTPMLGDVDPKPMIQGTPMGRLGKPEEVADAVVFLAGDTASYITGTELYVDGGWTAA